MLEQAEQNKKVSLGFPVAQQAVVLLLGSMMLDGGTVFTIFSFATISYWVGFFLITARREKKLTRADQVLIRWGYLMLIPVCSAIAAFVWHIRLFF